MSEFTSISFSNKRKASDFFSGDPGDSNIFASAGSPVMLAQVKATSNINILKKVVQDQFSAVLAADSCGTNAAMQNSNVPHEQKKSRWSRLDSNDIKTILLEEKYSTINSHSLQHNQDIISAINDEQQTSVEGVYMRSITNSNELLIDTRHNDVMYNAETHIGEKRTMITSFSKDNDTDRKMKSSKIAMSTETTESALFVPQSKFAKKFMAKSGFASSAASSSSTDDNVEDAPMFKRLKSRDRVMARYSADNQYYPAVVRAVMHGGFSSAQYDVLFDGFQELYTLGWADISAILSPTDDANPLVPIPTTCIAPTLPLHAAQVLNVEDLARLGANRSCAKSGLLPPVIRSIRYDSATGMATINENSPSSATPKTTTPPLHHATILPEKEWTVHQPPPASATQTRGAPVAPTVTGPVLNPKLLQRSKGGWKNVKK
jgi:hypothetical protein